MTVRVTARGAERTSLDGARADVLVCGASFAGLAVARELAGSGARVLIVDRYALGERATSACAAPTDWLRAMGVAEAIRQEIPHMRFTTPHGSFRYRLPWSWSSFDYASLCRLLFAQTGARFETAKVDGLADADAGSAGGADADADAAGEAAADANRRAEAPGGADTARSAAAEVAVRTDRGVLRAPLVVDALGWRRVLGRPEPARPDGVYQPPSAPLSRGLEVHPHGVGTDLEVWVERSLVRRGYGWSVPAAGELRVGIGSYDPRDHVRAPTQDLAARLGVETIRYQGNWFPHRLRPAAAGGVFFVGDSAGHCLPLSGEGIRTAFYFGIACGRELRGVVEGRQSVGAALERYGAFSAGHARTFALASCLQRLIPALPPRLLTLVLRAMSRQAIVDRAFGWYLDRAPPGFADVDGGGLARAARAVPAGAPRITA